MRVLLLVSRDVIDDSRAIAEAELARSMGHDAEILCWDRDGTHPVEDRIHGIPVRRVRNTGLMRWMPNDIARNPLWWRRAYRWARGRRPDLVVCHDLDTLPAGARLKRRHGTPLLYDSCELFYYMIEDKVPRAVSRAALRLERRLLRHVDHVLVVDDPYFEFFEKETPYRGPITKVMNTTRPAPTGPYAPPEKGPFTLFYVGSLTPDRLVVPIVESARLFPDIRVVVAGGGVLEPEVRARAAELPNVEFLGTIPFDEVLPRMRRHHAVPALTDPANVNVRVATSLKQFEAMAAGRPVIAARGSLTGRVAEETETGLAVDFSEAGLAEAVRTLKDDPRLAERLGRNALRAAKETFNWEHEAAKLRRVYEDLLGRAAQGRGRVPSSSRT